MPPVSDSAPCTPSTPIYRSANDKKTAIKTIISGLDKVNDVRKTQIEAYLVHHMDGYEFYPQMMAHEEDPEKVYHEYSPYVEYLDKMNDLMATPPSTDEEKRIIGELCSMYTPSFVQKKGVPGPSKDPPPSSSSDSQGDAMLDEIESADFPMSPPHEETRTPEYIQEKTAAFRKTVYDRTDLDDSQKMKLYNLLTKYEPQFSLRGENMGVAKGVEHEIVTEGRPFRQRLRTYSQAIQRIIDQEIQKLIDQKVIVPSKSPYASNVLLVRKPDPSQPTGMKERVCIDYVQLNQQTVKDSYPLPNIQTIFSKIGRSTWFTTMDLLNGFWQVMIKPEHRHKTAFLTSRGLYEWITMPFGLCNAPPTFQRLMDEVILPE